MAASISMEAPAPLSSRSPRGPSAEKYLVGGELVDIKTTGRRDAATCQQVSSRNSLKDHPKTPTAGYAARHHTNSDIVKEHVSYMVVGDQNGGHLPKSREEASRRVHVIGDHSMTPSTMPKDTAYITSGLRVVKYQTRSPGTFSPNAPRVRASDALSIS
eukprot:TRINITY_DN80880_c0_g1_i1.p1 TRINITY_DN80880_c0_g1~~TRINITY_DN80880_c0_g1_i1.p1  ORF type:complete len:178 (-),score=28.92 TRINITY_DN80880_c0_g1_i1:24-500(-)